MLLTNSRSIRDVIFFPVLKPESTGGGPAATTDDKTPETPDSNETNSDE